MTPPAQDAGRFEGLWRFPHLSARWKSAGVFATAADALAALDEILKGRAYRAVDRRVVRRSELGDEPLPPRE
jgi:hypothetical protein